MDLTTPSPPSPPLPPPRRARTRGRWIALGLVLVLLVPSLLCAAGALAVYLYFALGFVPADRLATVALAQSTKIYDRNGALLYEVLDPQSGKRTLVKPAQLPLVLKQATIATEDQTFYTNLGVDPVAVVRALYYLARYGRVVSGGSTIAQQLVKNSLLSPEVTVERKLREAILAVEVTRRYSRDEILTMYLNTIFYGNLAYGIEAASQTYFGKGVSQLDLAEAALLAGLPQAPALYDPCEDASAALARQQVVLGRMVAEGYISTADADRAHGEMTALLDSPAFVRRCTAAASLKFPHFVNYVRARLEQQYGPEVVYKGGLQVTTTIDPAMQAIVEEEARKQIDALRARNVTNASVVMLNPHTGEILAMLGSVNFDNPQISGQVNMADALRQPGSAIKPINYVTAFMRGWTPATPIYDLKTNFPDGDNKPPYVPRNYDGKEHGLVSARVALANSLNIPAVKTLYFSSTPDENHFPQPLAMIATARRLGITTFTNDEGAPRQTYGLALTLGGGEVKLVELTGAYAVFANQGTRVPPTPFVKIVDGQGQVLYELARASRQASQCAQLEPNAPAEVPDAQGACPQSAPYAYLITSILSDNDARALSFGPDSALELSRPAAVKTGTTDDFRDNWTIGYTPDLVVGVWVGNPNNTPMQDVSGVTGAAPLWHNVMERVLANTPPQDFVVPAGVVRQEICTDSGNLVTDLCPRDHRRTEVFVAGHVPDKPDDVWQVIPCQGAQRAFRVPPHDVGDLIPYRDIRTWARAAGWNIPGNCNSGDPVVNAPQNDQPTKQKAGKNGQGKKDQGGKGKQNGKKK